MLPKINAVMRLTRDPEFKFVGDNNAMCKLGLVASEKYKDKETTLWLDAVVFGKQAELINSSVRKGQRLFIIGKLSTDEWVDTNTNQKRSKTSMVIESFEFIEKRETQGNNQQNYQQQQNSGNYQQPQQQQYQAPQTQQPTQNQQNGQYNAPNQPAQQYQPENMQQHNQQMPQQPAQTGQLPEMSEKNIPF